MPKIDAKLIQVVNEDLSKLPSPMKSQEKESDAVKVESESQSNDACSEDSKQDSDDAKNDDADDSEHDDDIQESSNVPQSPLNGNQKESSEGTSSGKSESQSDSPFHP